jgi:tetratricopeptide (TPR) repeat protein
VRFYSQAIRLKPDLDEAFFNRGNARYAIGDLERALQDFDEAIRLKPDYADGFYNRGAARYDKGDLEGALRDFNEAIRLKPSHRRDFVARGAARSATGELHAALPFTTLSTANLASARRWPSGDLKGAVQDFGQALRLRPSDADALKNRDPVRKALAKAKGKSKAQTKTKAKARRLRT